MWIGPGDRSAIHRHQKLASRRRHPCTIRRFRGNVGRLIAYPIRTERPDRSGEGLPFRPICHIAQDRRMEDDERGILWSLAAKLREAVSQHIALEISGPAGGGASERRPSGDVEVAVELLDVGIGRCGLADAQVRLLGPDECFQPIGVPSGLRSRPARQTTSGIARGSGVAWFTEQVKTSPLPLLPGRKPDGLRNRSRRGRAEGTALLTRPPQRVLAAGVSQTQAAAWRILPARWFALSATA
jgi:hypothetical protein